MEIADISDREGGGNRSDVRRLDAGWICAHQRTEVCRMYLIYAEQRYNVARYLQAVERREREYMTDHTNEVKDEAWKKRT